MPNEFLNPQLVFKLLNSLCRIKMVPFGKGGGCEKQCKEWALSLSLGEGGGLLADMLDEFQCRNKKAILSGGCRIRNY